MRKWLEAGTGASGQLGLGPGSAALWLCGKSLPNLLMDFTLHSHFVLLGVGTKSQCKGFGVRPLLI